MQGGSRTRAIVQNLQGGWRRFFAPKLLSEWKRDAQRRHRRRINQNLNQMATGSMDADEFDDTPYEGLDAWDIW